MNFKFHYDSEHDVLAIRNVEKKVEESVEISGDIILDLDNEGKVIGVEIFDASEIFNSFNKEIDKNYLENLEYVNLKYREFRNMWFIVVVLNSGSKQILQPLPPLRKSEYVSPLVASSK